MNTASHSILRVEQSAIIDAPPAALYGIITDYEVGHQAILPRPAFRSMEIIRGGRGAGTELRLTMKLYGQTYHYHQRVSEPEPGRIIEERDLDTDQVTYFILDPLDNGTRTRVTIASEFPLARGVAGWLMRRTQPGIVRRLYRQELGNLAAYVRQTGAQTATRSQAQPTMTA